ncbi:protein scarlet-like [Copidosoma floridanum]|uniref:protein scarlet-like n=1 Tax=Copidosoma floridanum TaxID=29053 RepID=UPI0006C96726|nr:protein scarlet-like [Copidosoma floridanum]
MPLLTREFNSGMYSVQLYYVAKVISLIPGLIIEPVLFTGILFWISGLLNGLIPLGQCLCVVFLTIHVSTACGLFFSSVFEEPTIAMAYLVPFDYLLMITMGSFIKLSSLPVYIQWIKYLSWLLHSTEALTIIQWHDVQNISCSTNESDYPCITDGAHVLQQYDFAEDDIYKNICIMILLYLIFNILGLIFLFRKLNK